MLATVSAANRRPVSCPVGDAMRTAERQRITFKHGLEHEAKIGTHGNGASQTSWKTTVMNSPGEE